MGQKLFAQLLRPGKEMIQLLDIIAQQILILGLKMIKQGQNKISTDLSTLILKIKKSCLFFERRLKAVIEAGGCHVEGKKTRFKS